MISGLFENFYHKGTRWRGSIAVISFILTKQIFLNVYCHGDWFYNQYIDKIDKTKYLNDDGTGVKQKHFKKTGMGCSSGYDPIQQMWDRDRKIARDNFGRK